MRPVLLKRVHQSRTRLFWSPVRLVAIGAALGFLTLLTSSVLYLVSINAFVAGSLDGAPLWLVVVNLVLEAFAGPVGIFALLCGLALTVYSSRFRSRLEISAPPASVRGRRPSRSFRLALGGAELNLIGGLFVGLLNIVLFLLPEGLTLQTFWTASVLQFVGTVVSGIGMFLAFCGMALIVAGTPAAKTVRQHLGRRIRRPQFATMPLGGRTTGARPISRAAAGGSRAARTPGSMESASSEIGSLEG